MAENYDLIFGQGASSQYAWSDSDYQNGWQTVGSTPPTAEQFDALQRRSDTKAKDLNNRLSPLETTASKALARVTPAANMLPYFNSSNSATTTAISDFTKTLLDDKDAATARATLGAPSTTGANASGSWNINAATATKLATPRTISLTGNASGSANFDGSGNISINTTVSQAAAANALNSMGNKTAITDGTREPLNLSLYQVYNNGYPVSYGNLLSIGGVGGGELLAEWRGVEKGIGHLYYRNRRDAGNIWSDWSTVAFTSDINSFAPTKTGDGASGTWGIDISGKAASATSATSATTAAACSGNSATATKLASESGSNYVIIDSTEDSWSVIGSNPGSWLKSIRTDSSAPPYSINYSAAVAFGGRDTKGIITHSYSDPLVKFAGGNGSTANWKFTIRGGSNNEVYNLNNFATKTGGGASGTWGIDISGNAATATNADKLDGYHASDIISKIYPVGSIYISVSGTNPASLFGIGTWVEVGQGRTLWGADSSHAAGSTIEAGLPNITGTLEANANDGTEWKTGAFYDTGSTVNGGDGGNGGGIIAFDASRSNAIYGKSSTVQPPALVVHFWKRTA